MKALIQLPASILMVCMMMIFAPQITQAQTATDSTAKIKLTEKQEIDLPVSKPESATFFKTFLRTPFAFFTDCMTLICTLLVGFLEFWGYLFSGFDYNFPVAREIWQIGWHSIVKTWWWSSGVTWHLIVSLLGWIGLVAR